MYNIPTILNDRSDLEKVGGTINICFAYSCVTNNYTICVFLVLAVLGHRIGFLNKIYKGKEVWEWKRYIIASSITVGGSMINDNLFITYN